MNQISFYGVDICSTLKSILDSKKSQILSSAPPEAIKGYDLGVNNAILALKSLYDSEKYLINTTYSVMTEYDLSDLKGLIK